MLKVSFICSNFEHPVYPVLNDWVAINNHKYDIELVQSSKDLRAQGDFLFLISCSEMIKESTRTRFQHTLVLHASDLPKGKGWSPHIWSVVNGADHITLSLLEAEDLVDSGRIWQKEIIELSGNELFDEINEKLFAAEIKLIEYALENDVQPQEQNNEQSTYYKKRTPEDSEIDINASLESQFNLLRVCDPDRFPAFFERNGVRYTLKIEVEERE